MIPNALPQSLDDLLVHAQHYAEFNLRYRGSLPGTLFLLGPKGPAIFVPPSLADETAKNAFAADARLMCVAHGATATVMALEAWAVLAKPDAPLDPTQRPSLSPDRCEVVALMGEAAGQQQAKFLPILRNGAGTFVGFGEAQVMRCDHAQGRFAEILPAQPPTAEEQARAQAMLRARGIVITGPRCRNPNRAPHRGTGTHADVKAPILNYGYTPSLLEDTRIGPARTTGDHSTSRHSARARLKP